MYITFSDSLGYPKTLYAKSRNENRFCFLDYCPLEYDSYECRFLFVQYAEIKGKSLVMFSLSFC